MLASLLIVFREVMEAGLIIGIVLAATRGISGRTGWVLGGIVAGLAGAILVALFAGRLEEAFAGNGQEVFNAAILCIAVVMLGWHNLWMASHGRQMAAEMKALGQQVARGDRSMLAMAVVIAIAVLREGSEVVLFLYGIAISAEIGFGAMLAGGLLGILGGAALSFVLYRGLLAIPLRWLFSVTSGLVALLAAGMAGQAAALLARDDILPAWGYGLWDTSWLLSDGSLAGRAATALVGYSAQPLGIQVAAWITTLLVLVLGARLIRQSQGQAPPSAQARPRP
ncbi:FTR1 family iron permease [Rhizobium straminoryzae]|uniref:Iron permease n=1 Tax=Rhizobium straminoryzae TaxID=1387186 RepID=A0A549TIU0_9HYPH|nr:FTR1 family protein [Rhizobium straminoryzae]TRL43484.1 iron permease [Rhizobium straminoryzae]